MKIGETVQHRVLAMNWMFSKPSICHADRDLPSTNTLDTLANARDLPPLHRLCASTLHGLAGSWRAPLRDISAGSGNDNASPLGRSSSTSTPNLRHGPSTQLHNFKQRSSGSLRSTEFVLSQKRFIVAGYLWSRTFEWSPSGILTPAPPPVLGPRLTIFISQGNLMTTCCLWDVLR